jgi:hypothetical protein
MEERFPLPYRAPAFDHAAHQAHLAAQLAEQQEIQRRSLEAMSRIVDPRELALVQSVDAVLSGLGSADGYLGPIGASATRAMQNALSAYGITPDYGCMKVRPTLASS